MIYLIRHAAGELDASVAESTWALTADGQLQAERLIPLLESLDVTVVYSSPFTRAIATVQPFASHRGVEVRIDPRLAERRLSPTLLVEGWQEVLKRSWSDPDFALEGGESGRECRHRMVGCIEDIAQAHAGQCVAVCSHGNAISLYLHSLDSAVGYEDWKRMQNPDVFRIRGTENGCQWDRGFRAPD